mgnify:CR=1 FL=1
MSNGMNIVVLAGHLGADPELRYTKAGQPVMNMRLATTESYLDKDKVRRERTEWHSLVMWGKRSEALAKILHKGSPITIQGSLQTSSYEKDGEKRYKTEVNVKELFLGGRGDSTGAHHDEAPATGAAAPPVDDYAGIDDLNF